MVSSFIAHWLCGGRESSKLLFFCRSSDWISLLLLPLPRLNGFGCRCCYAQQTCRYIVCIFVCLWFLAVAPNLARRALLSYVNFYRLEMWFIEWIIDINRKNGTTYIRYDDRVDWMNIRFIMYGFIVFLCMSYSFFLLLALFMMHTLLF